MAQAFSPDQLRAFLEQTLSPHAEIRNAAEGHLVEATKIDGHLLSVIRLIETEDISNVPIRQAAAVHFKTCIKKGWDATNEDGNDGIVISEHDRALIKERLFGIIRDVPLIIQSQCLQSIRLIAAVDFPAKWDSLLPMLVHKFDSNDTRVLNEVLCTVNSIFKPFRYAEPSNKLYRGILYSLKLVQEPLLKLFKSINQAIDVLASDTFQLELSFEALRLVSRIYFSLNYQDLSEFFEDTLEEWMTIFAKYLEYHNPLLSDPDEQLEPSPIDTLQAAIVENIQLYADNDEAPFLPFLPYFASRVANLFMRLTSWSKHDELASKCIRFLASLVKKKMHLALFKDYATLRKIIMKIVLPNFQVREIDQDCFEHDPGEFIASDIDRPFLQAMPHLPAPAMNPTTLNHHVTNEMLVIYLRELYNESRSADIDKHSSEILVFESLVANKEKEIQELQLAIANKDTEIQELKSMVEGKKLTSVAPTPNTAGFSFGIPPQPAAGLSLDAPESEQSTVLGRGFHPAAAKLILKLHFETGRGKLSDEDCILLSERTKLAPKQVKTWFRNQNHRKKGNKIPGTEE